MVRQAFILAALTAALAGPALAQGADPHAGHDMGAMAGHDMAGMDHAGMDHADAPMTGALGPYPMTREASGTSWQPEHSDSEFC